MENVVFLYEQTFHMKNGDKFINHWGEYETGVLNDAKVIIFDSRKFLEGDKIVIREDEIVAITYKKTGWVSYISADGRIGKKRFKYNNRS